MVDDFEIGLKVFECNLLEKYFESVLDLLRFMEEVELLSFTSLEVLVDELIDKFLELFRPCVDWHGINSQRFAFGVFELHPNILGQLRLLGLIDFYFFASLHLNNLL
jgi:hypothetical protein